MKIFTVFLAYLAVASHFDHIVLGSPANVVARREGDIVQQDSPALMKRDPGQTMETRQGDPKMFKMAVDLVVSAVGDAVLKRLPVIPAEEPVLQALFTKNVTDSCSKAWKQWNWALIDSDTDYNIDFENWAWTQYDLVLNSTHTSYTIFGFQNGTFINEGGPGNSTISEWYYEDTNADPPTTDLLGHTSVYFNPPNPGETIPTGIRPNFEAVINTVGNDAAALQSEPPGDVQSTAFTQWVVGNCSQKWLEYNWVAGPLRYVLLADGVDGIDWGEIKYNLTIQDTTAFGTAYPPIEFVVIWLKSGTYRYRGADPVDGFTEWAVAGQIYKETYYKKDPVVYFHDPLSVRL